MQLLESLVEPEVLREYLWWCSLTCTQTGTVAKNEIYLNDIDIFKNFKDNDSKHFRDPTE